MRTLSLTLLFLALASSNVMAEGPDCFQNECTTCRCDMGGSSYLGEGAMDESGEFTQDDYEPVFQPAIGPGTLANVAVSGPGYIDWAIPMTNFAIRFDAAYDNIVPDRAEFFYPQCGCNGGGAPGPPKLEKSVDYQEISAYFEYAVRDRLSFFVEQPIRFINPEVNDNSAGIGDMNVGFKFAFIYDPCRARYMSFQLRTYIPTGDGDRGLGTDHVSIEPSILYWQEFGNTTLFAEVRDWIPVGGSTNDALPGNYAGNVLRYGVGASHIIFDNGCITAAPVVEAVGWSVFNGGKLVNPPPALLSAAGDDIINIKAGLRFGLFGNRARVGDVNTLMVSYGKSLTGNRWYDSIIRVEYRILF